MMSLGIFLVGILLLQGAIENVIPRLSALDEITVLVLFITSIIFMIKYKRNIKLYKYEYIIIYLIILFYIIGVISNFKSGILQDKKAIFFSGFLTIKPILIYILARITFNKIKLNKKILNYTYYILQYIIYIYCLISIINIPFNYLDTWGIRYGIINTIAIGFKHPSELDFFVISSFIIILFLNKILNKKFNHMVIFTLPVGILILFTGRAKAMGFFIILLLAIFIFRRIKKFEIKKLIMLLPFGVIIGWNKLTMELFNPLVARGALYNTSFKIAKDYFPIGTGFGTFGSYFSTVLYSPIYYYYGISRIYGISPDYPTFITDTTWASIIGETGIIGFIVYVIILSIILFYTLRFSKEAYMKLISISPLIYLIISSLADSILMTYRGCAVMLIIAIFSCILDSERKICK